jgi:hypothetical protein
VRAADRREADDFGRRVAHRYEVQHEGLDVAADVRTEARAMGWTRTKAERASLTAFMTMRQRQAAAYTEENSR